MSREAPVEVQSEALRRVAAGDEPSALKYLTADELKSIRQNCRKLANACTEQIKKIPEEE